MKKLKLNEYSTLANAEMSKVKGGGYGGGGGGGTNCSDTNADSCSSGSCAQTLVNGQWVNQYCKKSSGVDPISHNYYCYCSTSR